MPELPEVETVRRGLESSILGERITKVTLRRAGLRLPFPAGFVAQTEGHTVSSVIRRSKYLLIHLSGGVTVIAHLGMSGRFLVYPAGKAPALQKHDHTVFGFASGKTMVFNDPRRFGLLTLTQTQHAGQHPLLAALGPDPFDKAFNAAYLRSRLTGRRSSIKLALMDQCLVSGLGNIYVCEVLFYAGVDPRRPAAETVSQSAALVAAVRKVLHSALQSGGSSLRDFFHADGKAGYFQHQFQVYGREKEPCRVCGTPVTRMTQGGRSTFYCSQCQR